MTATVLPATNTSGWSSGSWGGRRRDWSRSCAGKPHSGVTLPKTESLGTLISRWLNNHQQPDEFYRGLPSRALDRPRAELFSDDAAIVLLSDKARSGVGTQRPRGLMKT